MVMLCNILRSINPMEHTRMTNTNDVYPMLYMEDPTLGIMTIETVKDDGGAVYNLQGVRMPDGVKLNRVSMYAVERSSL